MSANPTSNRSRALYRVIRMMIAEPVPKPHRPLPQMPIEDLYRVVRNESFHAMQMFREAMNDPERRP